MADYTIHLSSRKSKRNTNTNTKDDINIHNAQSQVTFQVALSFEQELVAGTEGNLIPLSRVSNNNDKVTGILKLRFSDDFSSAAYKLYVFNANNPQNKIISAHLHLGAANINGPVIVSLYSGSAVNVNGPLSSGIISNREIMSIPRNMGLPTVNSIASLYWAILQGNIYANVHSAQFSGGIVRGQLFAK